MKKIIFVCLGNICRSPLAEGIAREIINKNNLSISVDSAGIGDWHIDEPPHHYSRQVAKDNGFSIDDLRGRKISIYGDSDFDMIIAMDSSNYEDLRALGFDKDRIFKIGDFGLNGEDIPDPYYQGKDGFIKVYNMLKITIENLLLKK
ncbi:MAG: low molecular weight phosphotyrosine protein phosphatase [Helicobacteraceae bacterium]|nr:low molecular weight phosphotyrosine protein phosphatase [Helicobacteraceae bacterium]